ncbi:TetR/AcrR family transcriptional regulator [Companilactobacillus jidongensis]|uniref:TetR/AcrR family transcriptional regulator n=1 Tax=Companilactobacillus jidongensis TaxID=2486006 RepID=UPI000F769B90|nr:TetR/AcrR family transcriptional regulator [Companilactobacillus jidongensis]
MESNIFANYRDWITSQKIPHGKKAVLLAGLELFSKNGYHGTPTADIAKKAGVSQATIFKYFKTKQDLLITIIKPIIENMVPNYRDQFLSGMNKYHNLEEWVNFVVRDRYKFLKDNSDAAIILLSEMMINQTVRDLFFEIFEKSVPVVKTTIVNKLESSNEVRDDLDLSGIIRTIVGQFIPYFFQQYLVPNSIEDEEHDLEQMVDLIMHAIAK